MTICNSIILESDLATHHWRAWDKVSTARAIRKLGDIDHEMTVDQSRSEDFRKKSRIRDEFSHVYGAIKVERI